MGYLEFLVYFYIINTAWLIKMSDFDLDPLIHHPTGMIFFLSIHEEASDRGGYIALQGGIIVQPNLSVCVCRTTCCTILISCVSRIT